MQSAARTREQSHLFHLGKEEAGWERPRETQHTPRFEDLGGNNPMKEEGEGHFWERKHPEQRLGGLKGPGVHR